ncbi:hypothetical protein EJD97_008438 [Solanum chilense]|uniref:Uncharacterized protein n=1 Tax=Solanum chilense TaxID=4083 RepID=A0A6N2AGQ6_SOLCI|nr:hypothetical protein EJD97_008438 [Solanum chilense]
METIDFKSFVKKMNSMVANSLATDGISISDSNMVSRLVAICKKNGYSFIEQTISLFIKQTISSKRRLPTFDEVCYILYRYLKDPRGIVDADPSSEHRLRGALEKINRFGDVVSVTCNVGDLIDKAAKFNVPISTAVGSVASAAGAFGHLGLAIKAMCLVTHGGFKLWKGLSRK